MKRRNIIGSFIAVFLILFIPTTTAIQQQPTQQELPTPFVSYETLKNMDVEELIAFIHSLALNYPELYTDFQIAIQILESSLLSSRVIIKATQQIDANQEPQPNDDNQTLFEKIFWKVYNYRVLRLLISTVLFLKFQSKFTLWRTMTWGIRVLRLTKIGILLGFIDPQQQNTHTPVIGFEQDLINKTLTVISVDVDTVLWSDITEIGDGSCDPLPDGNVTIGDTLTTCAGIIALWYVPTKEVIGVFEF